MNSENQASEQQTRRPDWQEVVRILAIISAAGLSRYLGWESIAGLLLLLVALVLFFWLLVHLLRFLWLRFLRGRWVILSAWWVCKTKRCDYYQTYQAYGPPDLTHVGYHAAERLAIEHFASHSGNPGSPRGCEICKGWAERLRGDFWTTLMAQDHPDCPGDQNKTDELLKAKKKQFGFMGGTPPDKMD